MISNPHKNISVLQKIGMALLVSVMAVRPGMADISATDSRAHFDQGMEAFNSGNFGSAELLFRKIVESGDSEYLDRAWFFMARSIFGKKKYEAALFEFKSFLNRCRTDELAVESRFWMGESYYLLKNYPDAIEEFRRFMGRTKKGDLVPRAHDRIAEIYFSQKRYDEAVLEWQTAQGASADSMLNAARQFRIGEARFLSGRYDDALQTLVSLLGEQSDAESSAKARLMLGRIYQKRSEHQKALQMFNAIPRSMIADKEIFDVHYFKARSCEQLGQIALARSLLEAYVAAGNNTRWYYNALYRLGRILIKGQDQGEGLAMLERVRTESDRSALRTGASIQLGDYYAATDPERAIPYLDEAIKTAGPAKKNRLMIVLGKTCMRVKKYERAIDVFGLYLRENPFDAERDEINFLMARAYLEMGDIGKANEIFESIKKENPFSRFNSESDYYLALVQVKKGNTGRALSLLKEYVSRKNTEQSYDAYLLLLSIYLGKNDLDNAGKIADILARSYITRKDVETALYEHVTALMKSGLDARRFINIIMNRFSASETASELIYDLGNDNFSRNNFHYAIVYYDKYLAGSYSRHRGGAYHGKIVSLFHMKRYADILTVIEKAEFPPMTESQWNDVVLYQARSYYQLNMHEKVYMTLDKRNLSIYTKDDVLMYIRCALSVGDYRSAIEANDFLESDKDYYAESLYMIGEHLMRKEKRDEADLYFIKIINECPGTAFVSSAKLSLAEVQMMNGKHPDALKSISEVDTGGSADLQNRKDALVIRCHFEMGNVDDAVAHAEKHLSELLRGEHGEPVLKRLIWHYYKNKDLQQFNRYGTLLKRYKGNEPLIACLSGRLYFHAGNYRAAYNHFWALSRMNSEYTRESWYYLGIYSLLASYNPAGALVYFLKIIEETDAHDSFTRKALIQCAILYREMNNLEKSKECLESVLASSEQGLIFMQARNLYEEFGYGVK